jgi:hypothetical protein
MGINKIFSNDCNLHHQLIDNKQIVLLSTQCRYYTLYHWQKITGKYLYSRHIIPSEF